MKKKLCCDCYTGKIIAQDKSINAEHARGKDIFRSPDRFYPPNPESLMKTLQRFKSGQEGFQ